MHIDITTEHEAAQARLIKQPLGLDYQGRHPEAAHAATAEGADDDELPPRQPMLRRDPLFLLLAAAASVSVVYLAAMGAMPYALALGRWIAERLS